MKVLFAVDLTEPPSVTRQVEEMAERLGAELMVVHAVATPATAPVATVDPLTGLNGLAPYTLYDPALDPNVQRAQEDALHAFLVDRFSRPFRAALRQGDPARAILDDASELGADLIVVGKRPRGTFERLFVGSVATQVVNHADRPVLLMPILEDAA